MTPLYTSTDNTFVSQLGSVYAWVRLLTITITLLFNLYILQSIVRAIGRKCTGCKLFLNICASNAVNMSAWFIIAVYESRVWTADLEPRLCKIETICIEFWNIFLLVNIFIIGLLKAFNIRNENALLLILPWVLTSALYVIPAVTLMNDVIGRNLGFYDFAVVNDQNIVSTYGLMICDQNVVLQKRAMIIRYVTSTLPLVILTFLVTCYAIRKRRQTYNGFSVFGLEECYAPDDQNTDSVKQSLNHETEEKCSKHLETNSRTPGEYQTCKPCMYKDIGPVSSVFLCFHFLWQSLLKPLCVLYITWDQSEHFFDVGSIVIAVLLAYMPVYVWLHIPKRSTDVKRQSQDGGGQRKPLIFLFQQELPISTKCRDKNSPEFLDDEKFGIIVV